MKATSPSHFLQNQQQPNEEVSFVFEYCCGAEDDSGLRTSKDSASDHYLVTNNNLSQIYQERLAGGDLRFRDKNFEESKQQNQTHEDVDRDYHFEQRRTYLAGEVPTLPIHEVQRGKSELDNDQHQTRKGLVSGAT